MLKAAQQKAPESKPILEDGLHINWWNVWKAKSADTVFDDLAFVLFDQALLAEGGTLDDPASFVKRMNSLYKLVFIL